GLTGAGEYRGRAGSAFPPPRFPCRAGQLDLDHDFEAFRVLVAWSLQILEGLGSPDLSSQPRVAHTTAGKKHHEKLSCRVATIKRMTIQRLENVGIVVDDLAARTDEVSRPAGSGRRPERAAEHPRYPPCRIFSR
ncbi:MAG TPA: hypothetical protein VNP92_11315, partial [Actinophytocola sp.]|nr:hypothetical protein [Actinophytocola sp.]